MSEFCYGGFLSPAVCFDGTAVVFVSPSVLRISGERLESHVIPRNTKVAEPRLPCGRGAGCFSPIFLLHHFLKMPLWLFFLSIRSLRNRSRCISIALPCTCVYFCTCGGVTKTVEPLLKSQSENKVSLFVFRQKHLFACYGQRKRRTDILSGQGEIVSVADNNLPTLFFSLQQEARCVILRIQGSSASQTLHILKSIIMRTPTSI